MGQLNGYFSSFSLQKDIELSFNSLAAVLHIHLLIIEHESEVFTNLANTIGIVIKVFRQLVTHLFFERESLSPCVVVGIDDFDVAKVNQRDLYLMLVIDIHQVVVYLLAAQLRQTYLYFSPKVSFGEWRNAPSW